MHSFICKAPNGYPEPLEPSKRSLLDKILKDAKERGLTFKLSIEYIEKNLNAEQKSLYRGFILKASKSLGYEYHDMEKELKRFMPDKPLDRWSSRELTEFIDQSSAFLVQWGFNF